MSRQSPGAAVGSMNSSPAGQPASRKSPSGRNTQCPPRLDDNFFGFPIPLPRQGGNRRSAPSGDRSGAAARTPPRLGRSVSLPWAKREIAAHSTHWPFGPRTGIRGPETNGQNRRRSRFEKRPETITTKPGSKMPRNRALRLSGNSRFARNGWWGQCGSNWVPPNQSANRSLR